MIFDYLRLMRLGNCLIAAFGVIIGMFIVSDSFELNLISFLAALVFFLGVGGGNSLNDYFDYKIDKLNKLNRPIPSGKISRKQALYFSFSLFFISGLLSILNFNIISIFILLFLFFLLLIYAKYSKILSIYGNLIVAVSVGLIFIFAGSVVKTLNFKIVVLSVSAVLFTLSREIIKDAEDIKGDKKYNALSLPIQIGKTKAKLIALISSIPALFLSLYLYFFELVSILYLILIIIGGILFIFSFFLEPSKAQKLMKISMIIILFAFLFR